MPQIVKRLFQSHSLTSEIHNRNVFEENQQDNDDGMELRVLESNTFDDHLHLLKRIHLKINHIPPMRIVGDFHKNVQVLLGVYPYPFFDKVSEYAHQQKIICLISLIDTYQLLIKEYGLFLIEAEHMRFNEQGRYAIWIHANYFYNHCSHPIEISSQNEKRVALNFVSIIHSLFSNSFFKYRQISNLNDLKNYLTFVKKRNKIHKKCKFLVRERSKSKRRYTMPVKAIKMSDCLVKRYDRQRPLSKISSFLMSNISRVSSMQKYKNQSYFNLYHSRMDISKQSSDSKHIRSQIDSTLSTDLMSRKNISYVQLDSENKKTQKKSCVFVDTNYQEKQREIKRSNILNRSKNQDYKQRINTHFCPIQFKRIEQQKKEERAMKLSDIESFENSYTTFLGVPSNNDFLSRISQDPQNEILGSDLKNKTHLLHIIEEFSFLLT